MKQNRVGLFLSAFIRVHPRSSAANLLLGSLVILPAEIWALALALFPRLALLLLGGEAPLFAAADPAMRVQSLQHEFRRRGPYGIRLVGSESQGLGLLHQSLNPAELLHHGGRVHVLIQLQRASQIEPLDNLADVGALEIVVVDLPDRKSTRLNSSHLVIS